MKQRPPCPALYLEQTWRKKTRWPPAWVEGGCVRGRVVGFLSSSHSSTPSPAADGVTWVTECPSLQIGVILTVITPTCLYLGGSAKIHAMLPKRVGGGVGGLSPQSPNGEKPRLRRRTQARGRQTGRCLPRESKLLVPLDFSRAAPLKTHQQTGSTDGSQQPREN